MAPFLFRREEERKAAEVANQIADEYLAAADRGSKAGGGIGGADVPRPTVSVLVARLQQIRNHPVGRQKKKYLEALAEKVLDERLEAEEAAAAAAAAEAAAAEAAAAEAAAAEAAAAEAAAAEAAAEAEAAAAATTTPTGGDGSAAAGDDVVMAGAPDEAPQRKRRVRRVARTPNGETAGGGRKRKRRRRQSPGGSSDEDNNDGDDEDNSDSESQRKRGGAVKATPIAADGPRVEDVAGLDDVLKDLVRLVWMPLRRGADFRDSGSRPNEAVLLYGPSGCGKTLLAHVIAAEARVPFFAVSGPSLIGGISGESETNIRNVFDEALRQAPSLVFLDAIEALASKQDAAPGGGKSPMEMRMALTLTSCLDRLGAESNTGRYVVVLAATNKADSLDPLVRRRFGVEIAVRMPGQLARERILQTMTRGMRLAPDVDLRAIARMTPGFVGGDLHNVVKTAQLNYMDAKLDALLGRLRADSGVAPDAGPDIQRDLKLLNAHEDARAAAGGAEAAGAAEAATSEAAMTEAAMTEAATTEAATTEVTTAEATTAPPNGAPPPGGITAQNFVDAAQAVLPAAKREGFSTIPNTTWSQVGAMEVLRKKLEMSIIGPIRYPDKYAAVGQKPMGGILLWGPPGCGKTLVAKAVANESKANFISIRGPELLNKWVGESERALRELFERARAMAPCIIFFDEMDALAAKRDDARSDGSARIVNTLLTELDGVVDRTGLFVIGATNRPDIIDPAIKRPGRLGESIFVGPPTADDRVAILQTLYRNAIPGDPDLPASMALLAAVARDPRCTGFSGADLDQLLRAAGKSSLERCGLHSAAMPRIGPEDWEAALAETQPSTSLAELRRYEKLQ